MESKQSPLNAKIKRKIFTPGPVQTSATVKEAMLTDCSLRDADFMSRVRYCRTNLRDIVDQSKSEKYGTVMLSGTGTYAMECIFLNVIGKTGYKTLILSNGAFGDRMLNICKQADMAYDYLSFTENEALPCDEIETHLKKHGSEYSLIAFVHSESSTGVINPLDDIGRLARRYSTAYVFVDAMSSFGAIPIKMEMGYFDFVISSANKCMQGMPGLAFAVCNIEALKACSNRCPSLSFDLNGQWHHQENLNAFRTTAPIPAVLALQQAIVEYWDEGGLDARRNRYIRNSEVLKRGMKRLGFKQVLNEQRHKSHILTNYLYLDDPNFEFRRFFDKLTQRGQLINPYNFASVESFRIGTMGHLFESDYENLLNEIEDVLVEMNVKL